MNVMGTKKPVEIMMPVLVAEKFCMNCPEMNVVQKQDVSVDLNRKSGYLDVRNRLECEHLYKCRKILLAKEKADEQST